MHSDDTIEFAKKIRLPKVALWGTRKVHEGEIEITIRRSAETREYTTTSLERKTGGRLSLTFCFGFWNSRHTDHVSFGSGTDTVRKQYSNIPAVVQLCDIGDRWHLNDLKAGTDKQQAAIAEALADGRLPKYDYDEVRKLLKSKGLLVDRGYEYGTAWLTEELPAEVVAKVKELAEKLA